MKERETQHRIDNLLLPFLHATDEQESARLLEQVIAEDAEPIIKSIINSKSQVFRRWGGGSHDAEDLRADVLVQLLTRLREFKSDPVGKPISNLRSYAAVITYRACQNYLRQKYPQRHRLKNRLRYLLTHQADFSLWEGKGKEWLCGFTDWQDQKHATEGARKLHELRANPKTFERAVMSGREASKMSFADLLAAIFRLVGSPLELDDLVDTVVDWFGLKDRALQTEGNEEESVSLVDRMPDPKQSILSEMEQNIYLQRLWSEICQLPLRQRTALLLNLRDAQGGDALMLFQLAGVASLRQIAEALSMSVEQFAALWKELPLSDAWIAEYLNVTRQQVINLRKSARERLARRLKVIEKTT